jgi:hypothetical protein
MATTVGGVIAAIKSQFPDVAALINSAVNGAHP